jgi:hypothetical protein
VSAEPLAGQTTGGGLEAFLFHPCHPVRHATLDNEISLVHLNNSKAKAK